jgi:hypothetical protein
VRARHTRTCKRFRSGTIMLANPRTRGALPPHLSQSRRAGSPRRPPRRARRPSARGACSRKRARHPAARAAAPRACSCRWSSRAARPVVASKTVSACCQGARAHARTYARARTPTRTHTRTGTPGRAAAATEKPTNVRAWPASGSSTNNLECSRRGSGRRLRLSERPACSQRGAPS